MRRIGRRVFLGSTLGALCTLPACRVHREKMANPSGKPTADLHVHLFGSGDSDSGCTLSKRIRRNLAVRYLLRRFEKKRKPGKTLDGTYLDILIERLRGSSLDRAVLLAQDAVYDAQGRRDEMRTHVYIPNDYVLEVASRHRDLFIPCPSINPDRRDAMEELEQCAARGARFLKIHPPIQGVDVADRRHTRFFARCAELGTIVLVHTGHEHSSPVVDVKLADPRKLERALAEGCTIVACHCGTGAIIDRPDYLPAFLGMARRHDRLWGDTSILGSPFRVRDTVRLLAATDVRPRLLHGSDYPFPSVPLAFLFRLGLRRACRLQREKNPLEADLALKAALGFGWESAERAHAMALGAAGRNERKG